MRDNKAIAVIAGVATVAIWAAAYYSWRGGNGPAVNPKPHEAAGWMMAQQALALLKPAGQLIVIARDTTAFKNPASDLQLASFKKTVEKAGHPIGSLHLLQVDPLRRVEVPAGDFVELLRNAPAGSVLVSFMGPPVLSEEQQRRVSNSRPPVVAFCSGNFFQAADLKILFEDGLLQVAVLSRRRGPSSLAAPRDLKGWFDQNFMTVTANDLGQLSAVTEQPQ